MFRNQNKRATQNDVVTKKLELHAQTQLNDELVEAAKSGQAAMVRLLLERGANANAKTRDNHTALGVASSKGYIEVIKILLAHYEINCKQQSENLKIVLGEALLNACYQGQMEAAELLLAHDAYIEARQANGNGNTPLIAACHTDNSKLVEYLVSRGATINARSNDGETPLIAAARHGCYENAKYLLAQHADIEAKDSYFGETALLAANGNYDLVKLLRDNGADIEATDKYGRTSLLCAANCDDSRLAKFLLDQGANINVKDNEGHTAADIAWKNKKFRTWILLSNYHKETSQTRLSNLPADTLAPEFAICPKSHKIMNDPVTTSCGITFDRESLVNYFDEQGNPDTVNCPITNFPIKKHELGYGANVTIKILIEKFLLEKENEVKLSQQKQKNDEESRVGLFNRR